MNTITFNHSAHKELWGWLAENPIMDKNNWTGWDFNGGKYAWIINGCFACQYTIDINKATNKVKNAFVSCERLCPFGPALCRKQHYKWKTSQSLSERKKLAIQIRDYPLRADIKFETI